MGSGPVSSYCCWLKVGEKQGWGSCLDTKLMEVLRDLLHLSSPAPCGIWQRGEWCPPWSVAGVTLR